MTTPATFTCPRCEASSAHPRDIAEGYCGRCHDWTGQPIPAELPRAATLYVAGPMTGHPEYNLPAFAAATEQLRARGFHPVNPGRHGVTPGYQWADYIRRGLTELFACDAVALLDRWDTSRGARLEVFVARELGLPVHPLAVWLDPEHHP